MKICLHFKYLPILIAILLAVGIVTDGYAVNKPSKAESKVNSYSALMESNLDRIVSVDNIMDEIEETIATSGLTYEEYIALYPEKAESVALQKGDALSMMAPDDGPPLGIPGFLWGFCLGIVGLLVVFLVMDDSPNRRKHVTSALWGMLAWVIIWIVLYAAIFASAGCWAWW